MEEDKYLDYIEKFKVDNSPLISNYLNKLKLKNIQQDLSLSFEIHENFSGIKEKEIRNNSLNCNIAKGEIPNSLRRIRILHLKAKIQLEIQLLKRQLQSDEKKIVKTKEANEKLKISNCEHFALESNVFLLPSEIHKIAKPIIEKGYFKVKRIIKPHTNFIRLSINNIVDKGKTKHLFLKLRIMLDVKIKKLKMIENKDLKLKPKVNKEITEILTLNINKIENKIEELVLI